LVLVNENTDALSIRKKAPKWSEAEKLFAFPFLKRYWQKNKTPRDRERVCEFLEKEYNKAWKEQMKQGFQYRFGYEFEYLWKLGRDTLTAANASQKQTGNYEKYDISGDLYDMLMDVYEGHAEVTCQNTLTNNGVLSWHR